MYCVPGKRWLINPDFSTISLSEIRPPTHSEMYDIVPCGVIPIKNLIVL